MSKVDIDERINIFLDDSAGIEYFMCKHLNILTDNYNEELELLDNYVRDKILEIDSNLLNEISLLEEMCLQDVDSLKPLDNFPNLELVYLDHCKTSEINLLHNLDKLKFYETPEYPTNKPSLYLDSITFNSDVKILQEPAKYINKYFRCK